MREDGLSLDEVAAEAGLGAVDVEALLVEFPPSCGTCCRPAGRIGRPIAVDGEFAVVLVVERACRPEDTGLQDARRNSFTKPRDAKRTIGCPGGEA